MKKTIFAVALLASASLFLSASQAAETYFSFEKAMNSGDTKLLEECARSCSPDDAAFAKANLVFLSNLKPGQAPNQAVMEVAMRTFMKEMEKWFDKRDKAKDPAAVLEAYNAGVMIASSMKTLDAGKDNSFAQKLRRGIKKLPRRFPNEPASHALFASQLRDDEAGEEKVIASLLTCAKLEKGNGPCKTAYAQSVALYEEPVCFGKAMDPSFGMHLSAPEKSAQFPRAATLSASTIYVADKAQIGIADVERVTKIVDPRSQAEGINIKLNPKGAKKLEDLTKKNLGKSMAVLLRDKALINPTIQNQIKGGNIQISMGADKSEAGGVFSQICAKLEQRKLPDNLRL